MTISIPDTLTGNSEKYIVSIRLWSGGLSFSGYIPSEVGSFFYREAEFSRTVSYMSSLKEFFFEHDFLNWMYKRIYVVCVSAQYTLVPGDIFDEKRKNDFLSFNFSTPEKKCLNNALKADRMEVVFGLDEEAYEFCSRSLLNPCFVHYMTPLISLWSKQSRTSLSKRMYVVLHDGMIDIACFTQGNLLFVNSFEVTVPDDMLYYILNVWREVGMNQVKDILYLAGNSMLRNTIMSTLHTYLQQVHLMEIPSEAYLLGVEIGQVPMDLISLSICEL
ncbi:DUF3822 family protein [Parabacteroides chinchillae]|uniref:DUF3822 family protein n=1 Tax=Parabacteroides chinchillae TaxID=871327 RepID=A0A8G2F4E7_9BACT|nr:DUF3822 family protein [Parabacteroides chinchillae]SEF89962.1 Protein of unknown function [Parabacteroides chinchillae]